MGEIGWDSGVMVWQYSSDLNGEFIMQVADALEGVIE